MNTENLKKLQEQLMYAGFGQDLNTALERQMTQGVAEFQLTKDMEITTHSLDFKLHFRKSDDNDTYYFNKYDVKMENANGKQKEHTFYKNQNVSAKEAFNLLQGRAVNKNLFDKEGKMYNAWLELDFKNTDENGRYTLNSYHEKYGYAMEKALEKLPLVELKDTEQRDKLIYSLKKGNLHTVRVEGGKENQKLFIQANPKYKGFGLYNDTMQRLGKEDIARLEGLKEKEAPDVKQEQQQEKQQAPDQKENTEKKQGQKSTPEKIEPSGKRQTAAQKKAASPRKQTPQKRTRGKGAKV